MTIVLDPSNQTVVTNEHKRFQDSDRFFSAINDIDGEIVTLGTRSGKKVPVVLDGNEIGARDFFRVDAGGEYYVFGKSLSVVHFRASCGSLTLKNCRILRLEIQSVQQDITLEGCQIGILVVHGGTAGRSLHLESCSVSQLDFPKESKIREITLSRTSFSSRKQNGINPNISMQVVSSLPKLDRASFAFLHEWAARAGNSRIGHLSRGYELSIERELSRGFEKFILSCWHIFGNYGLNPVRPLLWIFLFYSVFVNLLFFSGADLGANSEVYGGWKSSMVSGVNVKLVRAFVGAAEGIVSPFSSFSVRRLIVPESGWVAFAQIVYNYMCFLLLFLFGFSIRRRFKVST
ncbi:MAG: hypothetical protein HUJ27_17010 [Rhodobacteraceae bacterium]|nr:hypothetical protein [Paracoccaceae bacterium]